MVSYFLSADWSKRPDKRSVYVGEIRERRIRRCRLRGGAWGLGALLDAAESLPERGPVVIGVDVVLGLPRGYWERVRRLGGEAPETFVDWLGGLDVAGEFFGTAGSADDWCIERPWFRVPPRRGGLNSFTSQLEGGMLRVVDAATGGKPVFAVSGIPGTVGSGTREFWRELAPRLSGARTFGVWPFDGDLESLAPSGRIVLCETYPRLAYAAALAEELPTAMLGWPKSRAEWRGMGCDCLRRAEWVRANGVDLGDLRGARANEDDFDALFTAAAALRCLLEDRPLWSADRVDGIAEGSMLLAGAVVPVGAASRRRGRGKGVGDTWE